jgi:transcriptional regulator with GAF, ATPase, and Fis domain/multidrug resistance efflux pump
MSIMADAQDFTVELANSLLSAADASTRAGLIALAAVDLVHESACVIHRLTSEEGAAALMAVGFAGSVSLADRSLDVESSLLAPLLADSPEAVLYDGVQIQREDYGHLNVSRSLASLAYLPLLSGDNLVGVMEVLSFAEALDPAYLDALEPVAQLAGPAILAAEEFERQRQDLLDSVHRMSQLYDLEKSLNATLDMDQVTALAPEKTQAMLNCQAMHLWLFESDILRLMASSGDDATVEPRATQAAGEGYVGDMAEEGDPLLIADPEDERLAQRNAGLGEDAPTPPIVTALLVPLMQDEAEVGVLEAVNKAGGGPFDDDDLFFLSAMAETVSSALKNASLMHAERKLEILEALVHVSSEITSTLRLDRLLQIIVNSPQNVLPYERCAIALDNRGTLQLKAVSGMASIPMGDVQVEQLHLLVRWLSSQSSALHLRQPEDAPEDLDLPEEVVRHFAATGFRALYALPLTDDQGRVGLLLYEAGDPDFLDLPQTEMIKILAGQATVAIRNALLYREVPLISLLEPLVQRKRALLRTSGTRRIVYGTAAAAVLLFLVFCPLPMRISGDAVVAPQHMVTIAAPSDGNVATVTAREGQRVAAGDLLGTMNDWQWRTDLAAAEAKYRTAGLSMEASLARGSAQAGADRAQVEFLGSELARSRSRMESAQLRSPIAGIVATPALQNAAGEHLNAGDAFAQVLDLSSAVLDVAVGQSDVSLVKPGDLAAVKLDSYPERSWHGAVDVVSPLAQAGDGVRTFSARVPLPNEDAILRAGMTGHAKIFVGYRPAGYVLLRKPALWLWQTLWNWIGW